MLTIESVLAEIDAFRTRKGMSESTFGWEAVGDRNFVGDLRRGRMPGLRLLNKVSAYIELNSQEQVRGQQ